MLKAPNQKQKLGKQRAEITKSKAETLEYGNAESGRQSSGKPLQTAFARRCFVSCLMGFPPTERMKASTSWISMRPLSLRGEGRSGRALPSLNAFVNEITLEGRDHSSGMPRKPSLRRRAFSLGGMGSAP